MTSDSSWINDPDLINPVADSGVDKSGVDDDAIKATIAKINIMTKRKKRELKMNEFLSTFREISSVALMSLNDDTQDDLVHKRIAKLFKKQKKITSIIMSQWGAPIDRRKFQGLESELSFIVGKMIKESNASVSTNPSLFKNLAGVISESVQVSEEMNEMIDSGDVSEDIMVNVKMALLPPALDMISLLNQLGFDERSTREFIQWMHELSITLAKDLAFNWDREAIFKDRERLFQEALPYCSRVTVDAWKIGVMQHASEEIGDYSTNPWFYLNELNNEIQCMDVGYGDHEVMNIDWLKNQISKSIASHYFNKFGGRLIDEEEVNLLAALSIKKMRFSLSEAWKIVSSNYIDSTREMVSKMSKEDYGRWLDSDGSRPMPVDLFISEMKSRLRKSSPLFSFSDIDIESIEKKVKSNVAMIWGISDAVCKVGKK